MSKRKLNPIFNYDKIVSINLSGDKTLYLPMDETQINSIELNFPEDENIYIRPHIDNDESWSGNALQAALFNNIERLFFDIEGIIGEYDTSKYQSIGEYIDKFSEIINNLTTYNNTLNNTTKADILKYKNVRGYYTINNITVSSGNNKYISSIVLDGTTNKYTSNMASIGFYVDVSSAGTYPPLVWICDSTTKKPILYNGTDILFGIPTRNTSSPNTLVITFYTLSSLANRTPITLTNNITVDFFVPYIYNFKDDENNFNLIVHPIERINLITSQANHTQTWNTLSDVTVSLSSINKLTGLTADATKINDLAAIDLSSTRINELLKNLNSNITSTSINEILTSPISTGIKGIYISKTLKPLARRGYAKANYLKVMTFTLTNKSLNNNQYFRHGMGSDDNVFILTPYTNHNGEASLYTINPIGNNIYKLKFSNGTATTRNYTFKALVIPSARYFDLYEIPCDQEYYHNFGDTNYFVVSTYPDIDPSDTGTDTSPTGMLYVAEKNSNYCVVSSTSEDDDILFIPATAIIQSSWIAESGSSNFNDATPVSINLTQNYHTDDPLNPEIVSSKTIFLEITSDISAGYYWIEDLGNLQFAIHSSGLNGKAFNWFVPKILNEMEGTTDGSLL